MGFRVLIFSFFFSLSLYANPCVNAVTNSVFTLSQHFQEAAKNGQLINQADARLHAAGLLVPGGGLCTSSCAVNILIAAGDYLGLKNNIFKKYSAEFIQVILKEVHHDLQIDGRYGLFFSQLKGPLTNVATRYGMRLKVTQHFPTNNVYSENLLKAPPDTLVLIAVHTPFVNQYGWKTAHALNVLGIDTQKKILVYSDPNFPNNILTATYDFFTGHDGINRLRINIPHYAFANDMYAGSILDVLHIGVQQAL